MLLSTNEFSKKIVQYVCEKQNSDGSWAYGTLPYHQWIDNFHTGYNLECIYIYQNVSGDKSFQNNLNIGIEYYLKTFFTKEGISKYYNNRTYPVDIHAPAQFIVTLSKLDIFKKSMSGAVSLVNLLVIMEQNATIY